MVVLVDWRIFHGIVQGCGVVRTGRDAVINVLSWWRGGVGVGRVMVREVVGNVVVTRGGACDRVGVIRWMRVMVGSLSRMNEV